MTNRKEIDTFFKLNDKRFDIINKTPTVLSNVPRDKAVAFKGYKGRDPLWKEGDSSTFYDAKKESTMTRISYGILPWDKKGSSRTEGKVDVYREAYDYKNAMDAITAKMKPRTRMLTNINRQLPRDDLLLNTTDMFKNVQLENSKEEREVEIEARKTGRNKSLGVVNF